MKIVLTVPLEEPVPPNKYGGTELVVSLLAAEYVKLGHQVYLLGTGDSQTSAQLVPIVPTAIRRMDGQSSGDWREYWKYTAVSKIIDEINRLKPDIIHNHYAWRLIAFENLIRFPMMSTMHGPLNSFREITTYTAHARHPYVSISLNQRHAIPSLNWLGNVYHGIDIDKFPFNPKLDNRGYFLFLGRTSPEKGLAEIVRMIKKTNYKLKIAAKLDVVDRSYFQERVEPYIDNQQIEFVGEVDHAGKTKLLQHAKALLLYLNWEEPFGLVVPEAYACGTPVIVNRRGSMPELVEDGKTGYLVNSLGEMKKSLAKINRLNPADCRDRAEKLYTSRRMAENYIALAKEVISEYHKT